MEVLGTDGLGKLTIEGIAARAGVGKATIYRGWSSRIELALEAMEQLPELPVPDTGSLAEDLRAILRSLAELFASTPLQSVLGHLAAQGRSMEPEARAYIERRVAGQSAIFERAVARGELPSGGDPELLGTVALGPVVNRAFFGPAPPDDAFIDLVVATVVAGFPAAIDATAR
jgi:AcrR family transcriptional regulator